MDADLPVGFAPLCGSWSWNTIRTVELAKYRFHLQTPRII
jgi:hypothetical protein